MFYSEIASEIFKGNCINYKGKYSSEGFFSFQCLNRWFVIVCCILDVHTALLTPIMSYLNNVPFLSHMPYMSYMTCMTYSIWYDKTGVKRKVWTSGMQPTIPNPIYTNIVRGKNWKIPLTYSFLCIFYNKAKDHILSLAKSFSIYFHDKIIVHLRRWSRAFKRMSKLAESIFV